MKFDFYKQSLIYKEKIYFGFYKKLLVVKKIKSGFYKQSLVIKEKT